MVYCTPFLFYLIPITWIVLNRRFKPEQLSLANAIALVKSEVNKVGGGGWTRQQIISLVIFLIMLFSWITENNLIVQWTGIRFGIGVLAVMGGIAYILTGVVNWRNYQTKVDLGMVWLYAGGYLEPKDFLRVGVKLWFTNMAGLMLMASTYWRWVGFQGFRVFKSQP